MRVRTAERGRTHREAVLEASLRIPEDQEQNLGGREPRESIPFIRIWSSRINPDYLSSKETLGGGNREIGDSCRAHVLVIASPPQTNTHLENTYCALNFSGISNFSHLLSSCCLPDTVLIRQ